MPNWIGPILTPGGAGVRGADVGTLAASASEVGVGVRVGVLVDVAVDVGVAV